MALRSRIFGSPVRTIIAVVLAIVLLLLAALFALRLAAYRGLYSYDPTAPQSYALIERSAFAREVESSDAGFLWPEVPPELDTLFLELELDTTFAGRWSDPYLEYGAGDGSWRQYFARGTEGRRYVDLTPLLRSGHVRAGDRVTLAAHGLRWEPDSARVAGFRNPDISESKVLVLATHPDDAEMAAFGLYSGRDSTIATITAGEAGVRDYTHFFPDTGDRAELAGRLRVWDSITVPFLGGVPPERAFNLGYFDGTLEAMYEDRGMPVSSKQGPLADIDVFRRLNVAELPPVGQPTWDKFVADLGRVLESVRPEIIVAPHPFIDAHSDHRFTTVALCEALEARPMPATSLLLYMNWGIYSEDVPHGPRTALASVPPWFDEPFPFASIYSEVLTFEEALLKAIALDGMRDFREFDLRERPSVRVLARNLWEAAWNRLMGLRHPIRNADTPRNASRPNEIFYVVPADEAATVCDPFLARWREGDFGHYQ